MSLIPKKFHLALWILLGLGLIAIFPPGSGDSAILGLLGVCLLILLPTYFLIKWLWNNKALDKDWILRNKQKEQLRKVNNNPLPFTSKILDTVIGIILLIILWPYLIGFLNTVFVGNTNAVGTSSDLGVVDNTNRLLSDYQDKIALVGEIQQRTDALGTSATKEYFVEWKLRNNNAIDAGERLATYITEHFKEFDAKWASDSLSWIATNKERALSDNQNLEQTISSYSEIGSRTNINGVKTVILKIGETIEYKNYIVKLDAIDVTTVVGYASVTVKDRTGKEETKILTESTTIGQQFFSGKIEIKANAVIKNAAELIIIV